MKTKHASAERLSKEKIDNQYTGIFESSEKDGTTFYLELSAELTIS